MSTNTKNKENFKNFLFIKDNLYYIGLPFFTLSLGFLAFLKDGYSLGFRIEYFIALLFIFALAVSIFFLRGISILLYDVLTSLSAYFALDFTNSRIRYMILVPILTFIILKLKNTKFLQIGFVSLGIAFLSLVISIWSTSLPLFHQLINTTKNKVSSYERQKKDPEIILHIVLDQNFSPLAIPEGVSVKNEFRERFLDLYLNKGFKVYENVFTQYIDTFDSIPSILNRDFYYDKNEKYIRSARDIKIVEKSSLFEEASKKGYTVTVYGSEAVDFTVGADNYYTYYWKHIPFLNKENTSFELALYCLIKFFEKSAYFWKNVIKVFDYACEKIIGTKVNLGLLDNYAAKIYNKGGVISNTQKVLNDLAENILACEGKNYFFFHALFTHVPYVHDKNGNYQEEWCKSLRTGSEENRRISYERASNHIIYMMSLLSAFFDRLKSSPNWDRMRIIVHGDHGLRFFCHEPTYNNVDVLTVQDIRDGFNTFFAVKAPEVSSETDNKIRSLLNLILYYDGIYGSQTNINGPVFLGLKQVTLTEMFFVPYILNVDMSLTRLKYEEKEKVK